MKRLVASSEKSKVTVVNVKSRDEIELLAELWDSKRHLCNETIDRKMNIT